MRRKRILCMLMLISLLLFRYVQLQQTDLGGVVPMVRSVLRVSDCDQVTFSLDLWASDDHHRMLDASMPTPSDLSCLSVGRVRSTVHGSPGFGHRPSVLAVARNHPLLAPPLAL